MTTKHTKRSIILDDPMDNGKPKDKAAVRYWYNKAIKHIPNAPGRKVVTKPAIPSSLVYYCVPCGRKFKEAQAYGACPYCSNSLLAKEKE